MAKEPSFTERQVSDIVDALITRHVKPSTEPKRDHERGADDGIDPPAPKPRVALHR